MTCMDCKNCGHSFEGVYCYNCGQAAATRRITVKEILTDVLFSVVKVNRGFLFTARELTLRPAAAIRQYLAGQRVAYYAPHKYVFLIGAVATFLTAKFHFFAGQYPALGFLPGAENAFLIRFFRYADAYTTLINIITIPVFAVFSFLLFRRSGYNYAENLVLNAYITSQQLLLFILLTPVFRGIDRAFWVVHLYIALTLLYNGWVYVRFFRTSTPGGILRAGVAMLLGYAGQFLLNLLLFSLAGELL